MNVKRISTPTSLWSPLAQLNGELERWFGPQLAQTAQSGRASPNENVSDWLPAIDIEEHEDSYRLQADLPGVNPKDINVTLDNGRLTISGSRETKSTESAKGYHRTERYAGNFYRRFDLPDTADTDQIDARCDHGVLEIRIPKQTKAQPKRIKVQS